MNAERGLAVVTGAGRGIGAAAAIALAERGFTVVATARREEPVKALAEELAERGLSCRGAVLDVSAPETIARLVETLQEEGAPVEALVNNAGIIGPIGGMLEADEAEWTAAMDINLMGPFRCIRAFAPLFPKAGGAAIVNVSSGAAVRYVEGWSAYCVSKAALAMLTRAAAHEFSGRATVYGFQPGVVDTDMQGQIRASGINPVSRIPRENLLPASDPAAIIAWLCADKPDDLNGSEFRVEDSAIRRRAGLDG